MISRFLWNRPQKVDMSYLLRFRENSGSVLALPRMPAISGLMCKTDEIFKKTNLVFCSKNRKKFRSSELSFFLFFFQKKKKKKKRSIVDQPCPLGVLSLAVSHGLVAVALGNSIELREIRSWDLIRRMDASSGLILKIGFTSEGRLLGTTEDGAVVMWDLGSGAGELWSRQLGGGEVPDAAELRDGNLVAVCEDGTIHVMERGSGGEVLALRGHARSVLCVAALWDSGAEELFVTGSADKSLRAWGFGGALARTVHLGSDAGCLSVCQQRLAVGCGNGSVHLFDLPSWSVVWSSGTPEGSSSFINSLHFSPDGAHLAVGSTGRMVSVLFAGSGGLFKCYDRHKDNINSVQFSPDGTKVLSGSWDRTIRVWKIFHRQERQMIAFCGALGVRDSDYDSSDVLKEVVRRMRVRLVKM
jgi:WD40 repeat protein